MKTHLVPSGGRLRSIALVPVWSRVLGLPAKAVDTSRRAIDKGYSRVKRIASSAATATAEQKQLLSPPRSLASSESQRVEDMGGSAAALSERARCGRIVRRGVELGVAELAAGLAFHSDIDVDAAVARVEVLASFKL